MAKIDSLEIQIQTEADSVNKSLDSIIQKLGLITQGISAIGRNKGLDIFGKNAAEGIRGLADIQNTAKSIAANIEPQMQKAAKAVGQFAKEANKGIKTKIAFDSSDYQKVTEELSKKFSGVEKDIKFSGGLSELEKQYEKLSANLDRLTEKEQKIISVGSTSPESTIFKNLQYDISSTLNRLDTLSEKIKELQSVRKEITITGLDNKAQSTSYKPEAVQIPAESFNYNTDAMKMVFGEGAENIRNWSQAVEQFGQNAGDVMNNFYSNTDSAKNKMSELADKLEQLQIPPINETNLTKLQSSLSKTESRLEELRTKLENELNMGRITENVDDSGFVKLQEQIALTEKQTEALRKKISEVGSQPTNGLVKTQNIFNKLSFAGKTSSAALSGFASVLKNVGSSISGAASKMGNLRKSFLGFGSASKGVNVSLAGNFKTLLKYGIGIESIFTLLNKMRSAAKDGFSNLAKYSSETNKSLSSLKSSLGALQNSLAVAFAPIVNAVAPYLTMLIDLLTQAFNKVGQFFSALTGKSFAVQAVKNFEDYAASLSKTGSAAKKAGKDAKGAIRPFDELKTISLNGNGDSSSGAFSTVPIESTISNAADKVKEIWENIFDVFKQAWESKGKPVIDSAISALSSLKTSALSVGETFYNVFTNGTGLTWLESSFDLLRSIFDIIESISTAFSTAWNSGDGFENVTALFTMLTNINGLLTSIGDSFSRVFSNGTGVEIWKNILGIITGVYNTIGNLANSIQTAWNTAGLGDSIWQGVLDIFNNILETIHNIADSTAEWANKLDFTPLLTSIDGLLKALEPLTENIGAGLEWFWNNVLLPIAGWTIEDLIPAFLDTLSASIDALNVILEVFKPLGEWLWNEFLVPLGEWAGEAIVGALETITELLDNFTSLLTENGDAANIGAGIVDTLSEAWNGLTDVLTPLADFLSGVFASTWEDVIEPALSWLGNTVIPMLTDTFDNLWNNVLVPLGEFLSAKFSPIINVVSDYLSMLWENVIVPLASFISGTFAEVWEAICTIFNKTVVPIINKVINVGTFLWKNVFAPIVNFLWDTFKPAFSTVFEGIKGIIESVKKVFSGLIKFVTGIFTGDWKKAWEGVKKIFSGIWDGLSAVVKTPINVVIKVFEGLANKIIDAWNWVKKQLNKISIDIPDWVPGVGGEKFGFDFEMSDHIKIPKLAKGAVFKGGNPYLAWVNDQKAGQTNVETPLKVIQEALREELIKFSAKVQVATADPKMLNFNYEPAPALGFAGAYGNYQYDTGAYATSHNSNNSDISNAIEKAVYTATYNAVSSAIGNSKTLEDIKNSIEEGHVIEITEQQVGKAAQNYSRDYMRRTGKPAYNF